MRAMEGRKKLKPLSQRGIWMRALGMHEVARPPFRGARLSSRAFPGTVGGRYSRVGSVVIFSGRASPQAKMNAVCEHFDTVDNAFHCRARGLLDTEIGSVGDCWALPRRPLRSPCRVFCVSLTISHLPRPIIGRSAVGALSSVL